MEGYGFQNRILCLRQRYQIPKRALHEAKGHATIHLVHGGQSSGLVEGVSWHGGT